MDKFEHRILVNRVLDRHKRKNENNNFEITKSDHSKFDRLGDPIDDSLWDMLSNDSEYLLIAKDEMEDCEINTIWAGYELVSKKTLNRNVKPYIFTSVVEYYDGTGMRFFYTDIETAIYNHKKLVFMLDQKMFQHMEE